MALKGATDIFIPRNPVNVVFRPLDKGVHREVSGEAIPPGGFYDVKNMGVGTRGPTKRGGFEVYGGGVNVDSTSTPIYDIVPVWKSSGEQYAAVLTNKYLYALTQSNMTPVYWTFSTGVVKSASGVTVKFSGATVPQFTNATYLTLGDAFVFSNGVVKSITGFPTTSTVTLAASLGGVYSTAGGPYTYTIRRVFHVNDDTLLDATAIDSKAVITDHYRKGMYGYNGVTVGVYSPTMASQGYAPGCVTYFKDRLWVGCVKEPSSAVRRQRIRWSGVTGNPRTFTASDYLDLPYQPGMLRRLVPLGNLLVAYFEDAIWYGVPTNIVDLPYKFDQVETGGIGLVGPRAVASHLGGHFFVGQDNVYFLPADPRQGPVPIGDAIADDTILNCGDKRRIYVVADPKNKRVLFGFPMVGTTINQLWAYDYMAKAWSHLDYDVTMLANPLIQLGLTWSDLSGTWTALDTTYPSWDAFGVGSESSRDLFVASGSEIHKLGTATTDATGSAIPITLETGDLDLDQPDDDKTHLRMSVKLRTFPTTDVAFTVSASDDGGNSWTSLGILTIPSTQREGSIDFGFTASSVRFRLTSATVCGPYTVQEWGVRVRLRGRETHND